MSEVERIKKELDTQKRFNRANRNIITELQAENKRLKEAFSKVVENNNQLNDYRKCVNKIEDFFEYRYKLYSTEKVKELIDGYIIELSKSLSQIKGGKE